MPFLPGTLPCLHLPLNAPPTSLPLISACLCPAEHVLEKSLHRSVLKPLRPILVARLRCRLSADGSLGRLAEGLRLARAQGPGAFGSHWSLPSVVEMEPVRQKLLQLLHAYSPSAQVKRLLQACKLLYAALRTHWGTPPPAASCPQRLAPPNRVQERPNRGKDGPNPPNPQMVTLRPRLKSILLSAPCLWLP